MISQRVVTLTAPIVAFGALVIGIGVPRAAADEFAYLVNVTVRPGYNFANADAALAYGREVCDKITQGGAYAQIIDDIKADFATSDDYQASYLISQSAQELCPAMIWQLRNSAVGYRPAPPR